MSSLRLHQQHIASVLLLLYQSACTSPQFVAAPPPAQLVETVRPPSIRVTSTTGPTFTLASPVVSGDSLVGTIGSGDATRTMSIPLSGISSVSIILRTPAPGSDSLVGAAGQHHGTPTASYPSGRTSGASTERPPTILWRRGTPTPASFVAAEHPKSIRVTSADGTILTLKSPVVRGDSLVGVASTDGAAASTGVALSDVSSVEVTKTNGGKTALLAMGIVLVPVVVLFAISTIECPGGACTE